MTDAPHANAVRPIETPKAARAEGRANVTMIPLTLLHSSPLNPRKHFDADGLAELADSICAQGVLQNLVARPHPSRPGEFEVAAGERRRRAAALAVADGRLPEDFALPVAVRPLDDDSVVALGLAENVGRHDLTALEEARAYRRLRDHGADTLTIARTAGRSQRHVQLRLDLLERLAPEALAALEKGVLAPEQARELCRAPKPRQKDLLAELTPAANGRVQIETARDLRDAVRQTMIPMVNAIFERAAYTGTVTKDEDGNAFADDLGQFRRLQQAAIAARKKELEKKWKWVDLASDKWEHDPGRLPYQYRKEPKADDAGAVIVVGAQSFLVTVHEGVADDERRRKAQAKAATKGTPATTKREYFDKWAFEAAVRQARLAAIRRRVVDSGADGAARLVVLLALRHFPGIGLDARYGVPPPSPLRALAGHKTADAAWAALAKLDAKTVIALLPAAVAGLVDGHDVDAIAQLGALIGAAVAPEALDKKLLALCGPEQRAEIAKDLNAEIAPGNSTGHKKAPLAPDSARKLLLAAASKKKGYVPTFVAFPKPELPPAIEPPSPGKKSARVKKGAKR